MSSAAVMIGALRVMEVQFYHGLCSWHCQHCTDLSDAEPLTDLLAQKRDYIFFTYPTYMLLSEPTYDSLVIEITVLCKLYLEQKPTTEQSEAWCA